MGPHPSVDAFLVKVMSAFMEPPDFVSIFVITETNIADFANGSTIIFFKAHKSVFKFLSSFEKKNELTEKPQKRARVASP